MKYYDIDITYQEIPDEISLTFYMCGCQLNCSGCHSPILHSLDNGDELTSQIYIDNLLKYKDLASCVLFMGGEWFEELPNYLELASNNGFKVALYTGEQGVSEDISKHLTYLKTGRWIKSLGGLDSHDTNQRLVNCLTGELLNYKFTK
jgi:anaerobic ribonucleoside-triphosphate reductase activating protein